MAVAGCRRTRDEYEAEADAPQDGREREDVTPELAAAAGARVSFPIGDEELLVLFLVVIVMVVSLGQLDGRSLRGPKKQKTTVRSDFFKKLKKQRSVDAYKKTLRCSPDAFDALCDLLEPIYYNTYGFPSRNTQYQFDMKLAVLLTYYGNGCGQDGDGIGGAAKQIGMSRTCAGRFIDQLEHILFDMLPGVVTFPASDDLDEWESMVEGFQRRGSDFPRVACVFDGTVVRTKRPRDFQGFYDKSGKPSYNCLAAIDHRNKFRYFGVFTGSDSDQSMWNQSEVLGARARFLCPPGINWLGDSGFKLWPFLMVPYDTRGGRKLTRRHRWSDLYAERCDVDRSDTVVCGLCFCCSFNYHLSATWILVECVFGKLKARFKILHGVTDRRTHEANARMISCAVVLHNLLIDVGDDQEFQYRCDKNDRARELARLRRESWPTTMEILIGRREKLI